MADWHYLGNYGPLGPLSEDQLRELIEVGVVEGSTHVWSEGMADWRQARMVEALQPLFAYAPRGAAAPPPPPPSTLQPDPDFAVRPARPPAFPSGSPTLAAAKPGGLSASGVVSDRSRKLGGTLNIFLPGIGRMYLGHYAIGALQLAGSFVVIGWVWSFFDGVGILAGACEEDGFGRRLPR